MYRSKGVLFHILCIRSSHNSSINKAQINKQSSTKTSKSSLWDTKGRLQQVRALSFFRSQTNSDFIFACVDKELRVNPRAAAGLCSTKVNVLSDRHSRVLLCCGPPAGLQEAQNKDNFQCWRQTGHAWVTWRWRAERQCVLRTLSVRSPPATRGSLICLRQKSVFHGFCSVYSFSSKF